MARGVAAGGGYVNAKRYSMIVNLSFSPPRSERNR